MDKGLSEQEGAKLASAGLLEPKCRLDHIPIGKASRRSLWRDKLDWKERQSGLEKSAEARG